jgi:hypothetical protein
MAEWKAISPEELGASHLGKPIFIRFPEKYLRDRVIGTLHGIASDGMQWSIFLRGMEPIGMMRNPGRKDQVEIFYLASS